VHKVVPTWQVDTTSSWRDKVVPTWHDLPHICDFFYNNSILVKIKKIPHDGHKTSSNIAHLSYSGNSYNLSLLTATPLLISHSRRQHSHSRQRCSSVTHRNTGHHSLMETQRTLQQWRFSTSKEANLFNFIIVSFDSCSIVLCPLILCCISSPS